MQNLEYFFKRKYQQNHILCTPVSEGLWSRFPRFLVLCEEHGSLSKQIYLQMNKYLIKNMTNEAKLT